VQSRKSGAFFLMMVKWLELSLGQMRLFPHCFQLAAEFTPGKAMKTRFRTPPQVYETRCFAAQSTRGSNLTMV